MVAKIVNKEGYTLYCEKINKGEGLPKTHPNGHKIDTYLQEFKEVRHPYKNLAYILKDQVTEKYISDGFVELSTDWFLSEDTSVLLNDIKVDTWEVLKELEYHSKHPRNLNTAIDVYFTFEDKIYGVRFQDWNIFRTLTDEQCEEKLRKYLIDNEEIKHPAKPI